MTAGCGVASLQAPALVPGLPLLVPACGEEVAQVPCVCVW